MLRRLSCQPACVAEASPSAGLRPQLRLEVCAGTSPDTATARAASIASRATFVAPSRALVARGRAVRAVEQGQRAEHADEQDHRRDDDLGDGEAALVAQLRERPGHRLLRQRLRKVERVGSPLAARRAAAHRRPARHVARARRRSSRFFVIVKVLPDLECAMTTYVSPAEATSVWPGPVPMAGPGRAVRARVVAVDLRVARLHRRDHGARVGFAAPSWALAR